MWILFVNEIHKNICQYILYRNVLDVFMKLIWTAFWNNYNFVTNDELISPWIKWNACHFINDMVKVIFMNEKFLILIQI